MFKVRRTDYDTMRAILILLVVVGHATFYSNSTLFGGINYFEAMELAGVNDSKIHIIASWISKWIYTFHMPIFISLAGAVYSLHKYNSLSELVHSKIKRLIIPLLFVFLFWNLPIKWFTGYYTVSLLSAFFQIIFPNNFYLWYLEALFFCFIIDYIIEKKCNSLTYQLCSNLMLCGIGIFASRVLGNYVPLGNPLKYVIWFWLGKNIDIISAELRHYNIWSKRGVFLLFMLQVIFFSISRVFNRGLILIDNTILPILMLPVCYFVGEALSGGGGNIFKKQMNMVWGYIFMQSRLII